MNTSAEFDFESLRQEYYPMLTIDEFRYELMMLIQIESLTVEQIKTRCQHHEIAWDDPYFEHDRIILDKEHALMFKEDAGLNTPHRGITRCKRCKSYNTNSSGQQTRGSDEATTVFVVCLDCNARTTL